MNELKNNTFINPDIKIINTQDTIDDNNNDSTYDEILENLNE